VLPSVFVPVEVVGVAGAVGVMVGVGVPGTVAGGEACRAEADALGVI
jgi:hypothetical protein